jgi:hypothetical protein
VLYSLISDLRPELSPNLDVEIPPKDLRLPVVYVAWNAGWFILGSGSSCGIADGVDYIGMYCWETWWMGIIESWEI